MKYFEMIQENVESHYTLKDLKWCRSKDEDIGIIEFSGSCEYIPDFLSYKRYFFVSEELKKVLEMFSYELTFQLVVFNNLDMNEQKQYYSINIPVISGLDEETTYLKNGEVDHIVLNYEKIRDNQVFKLEEFEANQYSKQHLFVNLDIVESILRRELWGCEFKEVSLRG